MKHIVSLIPLYLFFFNYSCISLFDCENKIIQSLTSPDELQKVIVFERDCGATTSTSTQIHILDSGEDFKNKHGNIFIAENIYGNILVEWKNEKELWVHVKMDVKPLLKKEEFNGIKITYDFISQYNSPH